MLKLPLFWRIKGVVHLIQTLSSYCTLGLWNIKAEQTTLRKGWEEVGTPTVQLARMAVFCLCHYLESLRFGQQVVWLQRDHTFVSNYGGFLALLEPSITVRLANKMSPTAVFFLFFGNSFSTKQPSLVLLSTLSYINYTAKTQNPHPHHKKKKKRITPRQPDEHLEAEQIKMPSF